MPLSPSRCSTASKGTRSWQDGSGSARSGGASLGANLQPLDLRLGLQKRERLGRGGHIKTKSWPAFSGVHAVRAGTFKDEGLPPHARSLRCAVGGGTAAASGANLG